jgi:hypothetical protein
MAAAPFMRDAPIGVIPVITADIMRAEAPMDIMGAGASIAGAPWLPAAEAASLEDGVMLRSMLAVCGDVRAR